MAQRPVDMAVKKPWQNELSRIFPHRDSLIPGLILRQEACKASFLHQQQPFCLYAALRKNPGGL